MKNDIYFVGPGGKPLRGEVVKKNNEFAWVRQRDAFGRTGQGFKVDLELTCPVPADGSGPPIELIRKALPYIVPELPTRKDSLENQLEDLRVAAFMLGMEEAVTWIDTQSQISTELKSSIQTKTVLKPRSGKASRKRRQKRHRY